MFKYFTWTDSKGYFRSQDLLRRSQISALLRNSNRPEEYFATIQDYDDRGNIIGCPIYLDIDSPSLDEAHQIMLDAYANLMFHFEVDPIVYFSGGKGFHIILPLYVRHPRCHEIVKEILKESGIDYDPSVYRTRSMWRCNNTWNKKGGRYKTLVDPNWSMYNIKMFAMTPSKNPQPVKFKDIDETKMNYYIERLPSDKPSEIRTNLDFDGMMTPCMKSIWSMKNLPDEWNFNHVIHVFVRHCYRSGLTEEEAEGVFRSHHYWGTVKPRDYVKVIASVYRYKKAGIGCERGADADLLRPFCSELCMFNKDFKAMEVLK